MFLFLHLITVHYELSLEYFVWFLWKLMYSNKVNTIDHRKQYQHQQIWPKKKLKKLTRSERKKERERETISKPSRSTFFSSIIGKHQTVVFFLHWLKQHFVWSSYRRRKKKGRKKHRQNKITAHSFNTSNGESF